ncbi:MAG TPA: hypothetical protein VHF05_01245 [Candidatus Paceibacterota bacterium]|nr:hypothetical protein [Candidatus Paceibacterota bacterium]
MQSIKKQKAAKGTILVQTLVFSALAVLLMSALAVGAGAAVKASRVATIREQAIQVAEAGIDYYRWHLAHAQSDYQDGTGAAGPYVHDFYDAAGEKVGTYTLTITPPPTGSTIVTIQSTGAMDANPEVTRTIVAQLAIPSLAKYAVVANDDMRFGEGTEVFGPIHSNGGIRFDGVAHNVITSALSSYNDTDSDDCNGNSSFGVHTCVSPADPRAPAAVPSRSDIFMAGRQFPVPAVDFVGLTTDLSAMKADAQSGGAYYANSGKQGYHIILKTNGTYQLYKVTSVKGATSNCMNWSGASGTDGWGLWTIQNQTLIGTYSYPSNGIIFVEDNLWVDGQIDNERLTIASGRFPDNPSTRTSITVNSDLLYTNYDGADVLSLIAQNNFNVGYSSDNDLEIDGAIIAQNGRVGRFYYASQCGTSYVRDTITLYGMIGTNERYGFAYTDGTGYQTRNLNYDANLLYGPPPSFPLTSDQYQIISWKEI